MIIEESEGESVSEDYISVKVGSMYYRITADDDPDYVKEIAKQANELISELKARHLGLGDTAAAVLALLNTLDQIQKMKLSDKNMDKSFQKYEKSLAEAQAEHLRLRETIWDIKKDLFYYRNLCDMYEERLNSLPLSVINKQKSQKLKPAPLDKMQKSIEDMPLYPAEGEDHEE